MDIKITEDGYLALKRAGEWRSQICPYAKQNDNYYSSRCGDWCPLFEEPLTKESLAGFTDSKWMLTICRTAYYTDNLIDERIKKETNG